MAKNKKTVQSLLNKLNQKSKKDWSLNELKQMSSKVSPSDLKSEARTKEVIQQIAKATGKNISDEKAKELAKKVRKDSTILNLLKKSK